MTTPTPRYSLHLDWPDVTRDESVECDAAELRRWLAMVPHYLDHHAIFGAPLMIEIRQVG